MASIYIARQGDTWDLIAWRVLGSEKYMQQIAEANWPLLDTLVFSGGERVVIPDLPREIDRDLPFWRENESTEYYSQVEEVDEE